MAKKPQSESRYLCPLFKKAQEEVCHTCGFYTYVRGTNPNDGKEIDHWACAIEFLPVLLIENSQQSRQTGAAVETFRNEMVKANEMNFHAMTSVADSISTAKQTMRLVSDAIDNH